VREPRNAHLLAAYVVIVVQRGVVDRRIDVGGLDRGGEVEQVVAQDAGPDRVVLEHVQVARLGRQHLLNLSQVIGGALRAVHDVYFNIGIGLHKAVDAVLVWLQVAHAAKEYLEARLSVSWTGKTGQGDCHEGNSQ